MKRIIIAVVNRCIQPLVKYYISRNSRFKYEGIEVAIFAGVFHPRFFFSTRLLLAYLKTKDLRSKTFLELGAGSGLIAIFAARKGAMVTATDISTLAVKNIHHNLRLNALDFPVLHSDLFEAVPEQRFDLIVVNPPYYKKTPVTEADHAWFCGENAEYFSHLFSQLHRFIHADSQITMVLADVCDITLIKKIAAAHGFYFELVSRHNKFIEENFIFSLKHKASPNPQPKASVM